jgi:hypothetical protein
LGQTLWFLLVLALQTVRMKLVRVVDFALAVPWYLKQRHQEQLCHFGLPFFVLPL